MSVDLSGASGGARNPPLVNTNAATAPQSISINMPNVASSTNNNNNNSNFNFNSGNSVPSAGQIAGSLGGLATGVATGVAGVVSGRVSGAEVANNVKSGINSGFNELRSFVEQNPSSIRAMVFSLSLAQAIYCGFGIFNLFTVAFSPVEYLVNFYTLLFSFVILVLESKPQWMGIQHMQRSIFYQAHFLSTVIGRALFLMFIGTFGMSQYNDSLSFLFGIAFFLLGGIVLVQRYRSGNNFSGGGGDVGVNPVSDPSTAGGAVDGLMRNGY